LALCCATKAGVTGLPRPSEASSSVSLEGGLGQVLESREGYGSGVLESFAIPRMPSQVAYGLRLQSRLRRHKRSFPYLVLRVPGNCGWPGGSVRSYGQGSPAYLAGRGADSRVIEQHFSPGQDSREECRRSGLFGRKSAAPDLLRTWLHFQGVLVDPDDQGSVAYHATREAELASPVQRGP